jgi:hypothetical protein
MHISRRQCLALGSVGAIGAFWSNWLVSAQAGVMAGPGRARKVILIFNCGAPSHIDLWDPKPDGPVSVRGEFKPIDTNVPGIRVSELLPRLAQLVDKLAILRTLHHSHSSHNAGMYWSIVGRPYPVDSTLIHPSRTAYPSFGSLVGWLAQRDGYSGSLPPYVITPAPHCDSVQYITPGQDGACLGPRCDPFVLGADPNAEDFRIPNLSLADGVSAERLHERARLLGDLDRGAWLPAETGDDRAVFCEKALALVGTPDAAAAFDLSREPDTVRERYGRHSWGQSHLLARRLVEAGVRFVATVNGPSITWDTHQDNFNQLKNRLVPPMEQAFAALVSDLGERGLLDETLVVWMGDFGRTPTINRNAGRDHWPQCFTMVLAGGGVRGGQVVGESDRKGAYPRNRPLTPADVHATVFSALGYDARAISYLTADGRPTPVSEGQPIAEVL